MKSERNAQYARALMELRSMILNGRFPVSQRLSETAVAKQLNLSRTPLRQAMERLIDEGLLERIETGGCRVASFSFDDILDAIELRGVLEGTAARIAAERGPVPHIAKNLTSVLNKLDIAVQQGALNFEVYVTLNAEFHRLLAKLGGSMIIEREVERACRLPAASPTAFLQGQELIPNFRESLCRAQLQHRAIFDAIKAREGSRAEALAREHARLARTNLEFVFKGDPSLAERVPGLVLVSQ